jgi:hypothetical protein
VDARGRRVSIDDARKEFAVAVMAYVDANVPTKLRFSEN